MAQPYSNSLRSLTIRLASLERSILVWNVTWGFLERDIHHRCFEIPPLSFFACTVIAVLHTLLDLLAPPRSLTGVAGAWVTAEERRLLDLSVPTRQDRQELEEGGMHFLDILVAGGTYADSLLLRKAIQRFKYRNIRDLGVELTALIRRASLLLPPREEAAICPVPLHWLRWCQRGWNQAETLAQAVAPGTRWAVTPLLKRVHATGAQAKRDRLDRRAAVADAFRARMRPPPTVILVDDVATTGATLDACARVLKDAGAAEVFGLVVALGQ